MPGNISCNYRNIIPVIISRRVPGSAEMINNKYKKHNPTNCVFISPESNHISGSQQLFVPSFMLSNVMSLAPKVREVIHHANSDFVA